MSKFTPGPWQVKRYANHELQTDFVMVVIGDRVHMIGYSDEDKANARLIAAAPDMMELLERTLARLEQWDRDNICCDDDLYTDLINTVAEIKEKGR